jgi:hypothetical protein
MGFLVTVSLGYRVPWLPCPLVAAASLPVVTTTGRGCVSPPGLRPRSVCDSFNICHSSFICRCPRPAENIEKMFLKLAIDNSWDYTRILGELKKLRIQSVTRHPRLWLRVKRGGEFPHLLIRKTHKIFPAFTELLVRVRQPSLPPAI